MPGDPLPTPSVQPQTGWRRLWRELQQAWRFVREVSGDDAYERYLEHVARFHPTEKPMSRAEHFRFRQEQKWNRLSRCC